MKAGLGDTRPVVVAGASLGGLRAVEAIRRHGWTGPIEVIGDEPHPPYTRPPLSKKLLAGGGTVADVLLRQQVSEHPTRWRLGTRVEAADLSAHTLMLSDGSTLPYAGLVAATGVRARRLPGTVALSRRHVVRTVDDSLRLGHALTSGVRLLVVGAGFIGCELAAVARSRGCAVTVVALDESPMQVPLGSLVGNEVRRRHETEGVVFHLGRTVSDVSEPAAAQDLVSVTLDDGSRVEADLIVEAIGTRPSTEWVADNDLDLTDGLLCDPQLRVVGAEDVVAVGDVARFPHPLGDGVARRIEHWHVSGETAGIATATLLRRLGHEPALAASPAPMVPSFTTHQGAVVIRSFGFPALADTATLVEGHLEDEFAVEYRRAGELIGAALVGLARRTAHHLTAVTRAAIARSRSTIQ